MTGNEKRRQKRLAKKASKRRTKRVARRHELSARGPESTLVIGYEITDEPIPDSAYERLPEPVKKQFTTLYNEVLMQKPKQAVGVLEPLIKQYPDVRQLHNYLYIAYQAYRDRSNAQRVLQEMLARFPDYLFGRIAYATDCLHQGKAEKVPEIFEGKYELKLLYPERKRFHISEVLSFCSVMAWYFHTQGEPSRAETYYELMQHLDPEHGTTRFIKRVLHPSWLRKWLRRLLTRKR